MGIKVCMKIVEEDDDDIPEVMDDDFWKPPNGGEPRLDQKLGSPRTKSALEVVVDKPDYVRNESVRKWSEASKAIVEQKQIELKKNLFVSTLDKWLLLRPGIPEKRRFVSEQGTTITKYDPL